MRRIRHRQRIRRITWIFQPEIFNEGNQGGSNNINEGIKMACEVGVYTNKAAILQFYSTEKIL